MTFSDNDPTINSLDTSFERIRMLAGILRFADELDLSRDRVDNGKQTLKDAPLEARSALHWLKHKLVAKIEIVEREQEIKIFFQSPEDSSQDDLEFYCRIGKWIKMKLHSEWKKITQEWNLIRPGSGGLINLKIPDVECTQIDDFPTSNYWLLDEIFKLHWLNIQDLLSQEMKDLEETPKTSGEKDNLQKIDYDIDQNLPEGKKPEYQTIIVKQTIFEPEKSKHIKYIERILDTIVAFARENPEVSKPVIEEVVIKTEDFCFTDTLAEIYFKMEEYQNSLICYEKLRQKDPKNPYILLNIGGINANLGNFTKTIDYCKKVLEIKQDIPEAYSTMGRAYIEIGNNEEGINNLRKAVEIEPSYSVGWYNLGFALSKIGNVDKAVDEEIESYKKAIDLNPNMIEALIELGRTYFLNKYFYESIKVLERAKLIEPNNHKILVLLGISYSKINELSKSIQCLKEAEKLKPNDFEIKNVIGLIYGKAKDFEKAIESFNNALKIEPNNSELYVFRGKAYLEKGDLDNALKDYIKANSLSPGDAGILNDLGYIFYKIHDYEEALKCFQEASQIDEKRALYVLNKACTYSLMRNKKNLLLNLKKAIQMDEKCKEEAKNSEDFKDYWEDEDFKRLTS